MPNTTWTEPYSTLVIFPSRNLLDCVTTVSNQSSRYSDLSYIFFYGEMQGSLGGEIESAERWIQAQNYEFAPALTSHRGFIHERLQTLRRRERWLTLLKTSIFAQRWLSLPRLMTTASKTTSYLSLFTLSKYSGFLTFFRLFTEKKLAF